MSLFWEFSMSKVVLNTLKRSVFFLFYACLVTTEATGIWRISGTSLSHKRQNECGSNTCRNSRQPACAHSRC